jgi:hypothetical protein
MTGRLQQGTFDEIHFKATNFFIKIDTVAKTSDFDLANGLNFPQQPNGQLFDRRNFMSRRIKFAVAVWRQQFQPVISPT